MEEKFSYKSVCIGFSQIIPQNKTLAKEIGSRITYYNIIDGNIFAQHFNLWCNVIIFFNT